MLDPVRIWLFRHRLPISAVVLLLVGYALAGFLWVPHLARAALTNFVERDLSRHVAVGKLTFNPFTFTLHVERFELTEADRSPIAAFAALTVNAELLGTLVHREPVFKEIRLEHPAIEVIVNSDGSLNLSKLRPAGDTSSGKSTVPAIRIASLAIVGGSMHLQDRSRPEPFETTLAPIEFTLTDFRTEPNFENEYRFTAESEDHERFDWSGQFSVAPLGSTGRFSVTALRATTVAAYLQNTMPFALTDGQIDLTGRYELGFDAQTHLKIQLPAVAIDNLSIAPNDAPDSAWLRFPHFIVADTTLSLADRTLHVGTLRLAQAHVVLQRDAHGTINLTRLAPQNQTPPTSDAETPASSSQTSTKTSPPWHVALDRLAVEQATVDVEDDTVAPKATFTLAPLNVAVENYSNEPANRMQVDIETAIDHRARLTVSGPVSLDPLSADMKIAVRAFDLASFQPYVAASTDLTVERGSLSASATLHYSARPAPRQPGIVVTGDLAIDALRTQDNLLHQDLINWHSLKVAGIDLRLDADRPQHNRLRIESVVADRAYGRVAISANRKLNIADVLNPPRTTAATAQPKPAAAHRQPTKLAIQIHSVRFEDGVASFADYSVEPSFAAKIEGLHGTIAGLSSQRAARADVRLDGSVDRYAPVSISGEINPLSNDVYSDLALNFKNVDLTLFNPYSGKFAGYNISKGKLTTELHYKVENGILDARHHIIVDQLEFGAATASKDAVSLPVKFAVALLKDRNGVIDLDLPVTGNLHDPKFSLGPIVWQALKTTLEKIVASPFKLLGGLFGGGEELSFIEFAPGSAQLSARATEKLAALSRGLKERPQLKLDIPLDVRNEADTTALARAALDTALAPLRKPSDGGKEVARLNALTALYDKTVGRHPEPPQVADGTDPTRPYIDMLERALLAKLAPTPAQLDELARARGSAVRDAILADGAVEPDRVFLIQQSPRQTTRQITQSGAVRMQLKLE